MTRMKKNVAGLAAAAAAERKVLRGETVDRDSGRNGVRLGATQLRELETKLRRVRGRKWSWSPPSSSSS